MKLRDWPLRRWALVIALIILLPLIGLRLHLKWRVHRAVAELRVAGQPTRFEDLNGRGTEGRPILTVALTNAVIQLKRASSLGKELHEALPIVGAADTPRAGITWEARQVAATKSYLATNREAMRGIHEAIAAPNAMWQSSYNADGLDVYGIVHAKQAATHLSFEAAYLAQGGDVSAALRSVAPIFVLAERMQAEPTQIVQLVRVAIQAIGGERLKYVLGSGPAANDDLVALRTVLRRVLSGHSMAHVCQGELVFFLEPCFYRSQRAYIGVDFLPPDAGTFEDYKERAWVLAYRLSGLADQDILYAIHANAKIAAEATTLGGQAKLASQGTNYLPSARGLRFHHWSEQHVAALVGTGTAGGLVGNYAHRFVEIYGETVAADAALAVAQYRLQHDAKLPASLDELVPEFLEAVPIEPQSGKPFELIVTTDGYGIGRGTSVFSVKLRPTPATALP